MTLQEKTRELLDIRAAKSELLDELKQAKELEEECEQAIIQLMNDQSLDAFRNGDCQITKRVTQKPRLGNYQELLEYIIQTGGYDLLQKRISEEAVRERWDNGIVVPGVAPFVKQSLTVRGV